MRVLVAPSRFDDALTAAQAADAIRDGWAVGAPHVELSTLGLTDAGPGWLDALDARLGPDSTTEVLTVPDPWGRPVPVELLLASGRSPYDSPPDDPTANPAPRSGAKRTAYVEAAQACSLGERPGPAETASSIGLGFALIAARQTEVERIVVGLDGALVLDGGFGLLAALGAGPLDVLGHGPAGLAELSADDLAGLPEVIQRWRNVRVVAAGDLRQPLLGLSGVAATWGPAAGADGAQAQHIESGLGHAVELVRRLSPERTDLLTGRPLRPDRVAGVGAGAGLGFGLSVLGADLVDGASCAAQELGLEAALDGIDLLVTGTAVLDWSGGQTGPIARAAAAAQQRGIPVVVVAGRVIAGRRETMAAGINGAYAACASLADWPAFLAAPAQHLAARAAAVAHTWCPS